MENAQHSTDVMMVLVGMSLRRKSVVHVEEVENNIHAHDADVDGDG